MEIAEWCIFGGAFVTGIVLLLYVFKTDNADPDAVEVHASPRKEKLPCILCGSRLYSGETVSSKIIRTEGDTIVHVYGCPNCYGATGNVLKKCPICDTVLKRDACVTGRMWDRPGGKKHLHILGCDACRGGKRTLPRSGN
ncbi:MAG TPA: hypothetical protein PK544_04090 [Spirochaetota bacterium]|nr:hypothetical protein [Spirochaetota bacterium]HPJ38151.1 hypothetical protein [Spirochaetota bacterium]